MRVARFNEYGWFAHTLPFAPEPEVADHAGEARAGEVMKPEIVAGGAGNNYNVGMAASDGNIVGKAILRARTAAGLTRAQLAALLKTDQSNIARLENGRSQATTNTLRRIAIATGKRITIRFEP